MHRLLAAMILICLAPITSAQDFSGLARLDAPQSQIQDLRKGVQIDLALSQGVPWRLFTLDNPRRLVIDFREVAWQGVDVNALDQSDRIQNLRAGGFRPGWSRLVADLDVPLVLQTAEMQVDETTGTAHLSIRLSETNAESYAAASGVPNDPFWSRPSVALDPQARDPKPDWAATVVVLDPGHGGVDPGAERGATQEKDLMLTLAREMRDTLRRAGGFEVHLTRDSDSFVSLEGRVAFAHEKRADIFISLHADIVQKGHAEGATVYTLSEEASDAASQYLAERHDRSAVLAGIDLSGTDDVIANVLLDLARLETAPRSERLAKAMVLGMQGAVGQLNNKPYRHGGFSVLKAADIPSVLIEVGFMSSDSDLANLKNEDWRQRLTEGVRDGLQAWVIADKAARELVRK